MKDVGRGERTNFGKGNALFLIIEEALKRLLDSPWNQINQNLRKRDDFAKMSKIWASTRGLKKFLGTKLWKGAFKRLYGLPRAFKLFVGTKIYTNPCYLLIMYENL